MAHPPLDHTFITDLAAELPEIPPDSIISRAIYNDERVRVVLFGFAAGQQLSEHTASQPAMLIFLEGEAELVLGEQPYTAGAGAWVHMAARLPHSVTAKTRVVMLLVLLQDNTAARPN